MNDSMGPYIVNEVLKMISEKDIQIKDAKVLILGFTFKENCPDIRNTRVIDIYNELIKINTVPSICDPIASKEIVL